MREAMPRHLKLVEESHAQLKDSVSDLEDRLYNVERRLNSDSEEDDDGPSDSDSSD